MELDKKKELELLWQCVTQREMYFRQEGDKYMLTSSVSKSDMYINEKQNIYNIFITPQVMAVYRLMKKLKSLDVYISFMYSHNVKDETIYHSLKHALSILKGDSEYLDRGKTELLRPYMVAWDITSLCNLKCIHCLYPREIDTKKQDMSTMQVLKAVNIMINFGIRIFWIGGGEPLLRVDIVTILKYIKKMGGKIVIASNGIALHRNPQLCNTIIKTVDEITISLDGSTSEIHATLRKPEESFLKVIEVIKDIIGYKNRCLLKIFTCVGKHNIKDIDNIIDLSSMLKADSWGCQTLVPMGLGTNVRYLIPDWKDRKKLINTATNKRKEYEGRLMVQEYVPLVTMKKSYDQPTLECAAGNAIVYLGSNGAVYPCSRLAIEKYYIGNIESINLEYEWDNHNVFKSLRNISVSDSICSKCSNLQMGMCNSGCKAEKERIFSSTRFPDPACEIGKQLYASSNKGE